ncbi:MAG: DUF3987 domain-containing protein [Phycisphaerae bacterium]
MKEPSLNDAAPLAGGAVVNETNSSKYSRASWTDDKTRDLKPLDHARGLFARGIPPLPIPHKSKKCLVRQWSRLRLKSEELPKYFDRSPLNIGGLLGEPAGWIVDVDLDHPLAIELADRYLPATSMMWGRASKRRSHRLYRLTGPAQTRMWKDPTEGMIVELRSTGCQSVAPGSTHPSGERVEWDADGDPATVDPADLIEGIEGLYKAALTIRAGTSAPPTSTAAPPGPAPLGATNTAYAREALHRESLKVAAAPEGTRNDTLNRAAFSVGTLIGCGELDRGLAEQSLHDAARTCGLPESEARSTVRSGIEAGLKSPRDRSSQGSVRTQTLADATNSEVSVPAPAPAFDVTALIPPSVQHVGHYWNALAHSTQTPFEMSAVLGLAVASGCICQIAEVRGYGDHVEPAPIWGLVLCDSAARKSAVLKDLCDPIVAWERRRAEELRSTIAEATERRGLDELRLESLRKSVSIKNDPSSREEALLLARSIAEERVPSVPVLLTSEPTLEALAQQMMANHERALIASAEADIFDIAQGRYSGVQNLGLLLKGHAGDPFRSPRVTRTGDFMDRPTIAMAMCVQPEAVKDLWSDAQAKGRGLLARFAVIAPPDRIGFRETRPAPVPKQHREGWAATLGRLLAHEPGDAAVYIRLSAEADDLYREFQVATEKALGDGDLEDRKAWGGKLCGLALRIALTLHALGTWGQSGKPADFPRIGIETMRAAIAWANFLASAEKHARARLGETEVHARLRTLVNWITSKGGSVTPSEVSRGLQRYRKSPSAVDDATKDLDRLKAGGYGDWHPSNGGPDGGRPTNRFQLFAAGTRTETPHEPAAGESRLPAGSQERRA